MRGGGCVVGGGMGKIRFYQFLLKSWWEPIKNLDSYYKMMFCQKRLKMVGNSWKRLKAIKNIWKQLKTTEIGWKQLKLGKNKSGNIYTITIPGITILGVTVPLRILVFDQSFPVNPISESRGVAWAWQTKDERRTKILVSNIV